MEVLLESLEGELASVGNFDLRGRPAGRQRQRSRIARPTAGAAIGFDRLPRARYRVTVAPPADLPGDLGITSAEIDLRNAGATVTQAVAMVKRTRILGRLGPDGDGRRTEGARADVGTMGSAGRCS